METYYRICIEDYFIADRDGNQFELKWGNKYLTSAEEDSSVTVFSKFWVKVPSKLFAGEKRFT